MIVSELIELLRSFPADARCVTAGFDESGIDDIATVKMVGVRFDVRSPGQHCGPHEKDDLGIPCVWIDG